MFAIYVRLIFLILFQGKGTLVTYWLLGEIIDPSAPKDKKPLIKIQNQFNQSGSLSHLIPFKQRMDGSRPSSRRGSGILITKPIDINRLEKEVQPKLHVVKLQRQHSDPIDVTTNGGSDTLDEDKLSISFSIPLNTSPNNVKIISQPKVKLKDSQINSVNNHKANKIGNNNWIPKLPTANSFDNGTKKSNEHLKDYSSVPLLSKAETPNDSIV